MMFGGGDRCAMLSSLPFERCQPFWLYPAGAQTLAHSKLKTCKTIYEEYIRKILESWSPDHNGLQIRSGRANAAALTRYTSIIWLSLF